MPNIIYFNSSCSHCEATITCLSGFFSCTAPREASLHESYCRDVRNNLLSMALMSAWLLHLRACRALFLRNAAESGLTRWRLTALVNELRHLLPSRSTLGAQIAYKRRCNLILGMSQQSFNGFFWNLQFSRPKSQICAREQRRKNVTAARARWNASKEMFLAKLFLFII